MKAKYFLSICAIAAIVGCGTNDDYKAKDGGSLDVKVKAQADNSTPKLDKPKPDKIQIKPTEPTDVSLKILNSNLSFNSHHEDERYMGSFSNGENLLSFSRWHNALRVVDLNDISKVKFDDKFIHVKGQKGEGEIDASTGASEQILSSIVEDNNNLYALLKPHGGGENDLGKSGLYKVSLNNISSNIWQGSVSGGDFYATKDGTSLDIYANTLALGTKTGIVLFNTNSLSKPKRSLNIGEIKTISINDEFIYASVHKDTENKLVVLNHLLSQTNSLNINTLINSTDKKAYPKKIVSNKNGVYFTLKTNKHANILYCYDAKTSMIKQIDLATNIKSLSISQNGKLLIVATKDTLQVISADTLKVRKTLSQANIQNAFMDDKGLISMVLENSVIFAQYSEK